MLPRPKSEQKYKWTGRCGPACGHPGHRAHSSSTSRRTMYRNTSQLAAVLLGDSPGVSGHRKLTDPFLAIRQRPPDSPCERPKLSDRLAAQFDNIRFAFRNSSNERACVDMEFAHRGPHVAHCSTSRRVMALRLNESSSALDLSLDVAACFRAVTPSGTSAALARRSPAFPGAAHDPHLELALASRLESNRRYVSPVSQNRGRLCRRLTPRSLP